MVAEALQFRGELIERPDLMVEAAYFASHLLGFGVSEEEVQATLVEDHELSPEDAYLALKMGKLR